MRIWIVRILHFMILVLLSSICLSLVYSLVLTSFTKVEQVCLICEVKRKQCLIIAIRFVLLLLELLNQVPICKGKCKLYAKEVIFYVCCCCEHSSCKASFTVFFCSAPAPRLAFPAGVGRMSDRIRDGICLSAFHLLNHEVSS